MARDGAGAPDLLAARRVLAQDRFAEVWGRELELLPLLREQRRASSTTMGETVSARMAEVVQAAVAMRAAESVIELTQYRLLAGPSRDLYRRVLATAAFEVGEESEERRIERFKAAADHASSVIGGNAAGAFVKDRAGGQQTLSSLPVTSPEGRLLDLLERDPAGLALRELNRNTARTLSEGAPP